MNIDKNDIRPLLRLLPPLAFILALIPLPASALWPKTDNDFALLPPYCKPRLQEDRYPKQARKWRNLLGGSTYLHIHHYCNALFNLMKAKISFPPNKALLRTALNEIKYVEEKWPSNSKLKPEMFVKKGDILILLGQATEGIKNYLTAARLKPDYSLPYIRLAEYYAKHDKIDVAIDWLKEGQNKSPKSKKIKRLLKELLEKQKSTPPND